MDKQDGPSQAEAWVNDSDLKQWAQLPSGDFQQEGEDTDAVGPVCVEADAFSYTCRGGLANLQICTQQQKVNPRKTTEDGTARS